jgi:hypothetical protein
MRFTWALPSLRHQFHDERIGPLDRLLIKPQKERPDFNRRMFDEDFSQVFNYYRRRSGTLFGVNTNDQELTDRLLGNVRTRHSPHSLDETIYAMVEEIAQSLVWCGYADYFLHDNAEKGETHIASFASDRVFHFFGLRFQFLPKRVERHWDKEDVELPREIRFMDKAKLLHFRLPPFIRQILSSQNKVLATLDKHHWIGTSFFPEVTHENPNPKNFFDFRIWREVEDRVLYRATRNTGWKGRKYDSSKRSDFFDCFRLIKFRKNQLILRDSILEQMSDELSQAGRHYRSDFQIKIIVTDALPSINEIDQLEVKLAHEEVDFDEVMEFCFKR